MGLTHYKSKAPGWLKAASVSSVALALMVGFMPTIAKAGDMVAYEIVKGEEIPKSLTGKAGDAKKGYQVAINRKLGNCLACHSMPAPDQPFHGQVGPDLKGIASRMSEGRLRLQIVNSKKFNPDSIMPAFYRTDGFNRVMKKFVGKSVLTAEQVEDVVAYLKTLK